MSRSDPLQIKSDIKSVIEVRFQLSTGLKSQDTGPMHSEGLSAESLTQALLHDSFPRNSHGGSLLRLQP